MDTVKYQLINLGYDLNVDLGLKQNKNPLNLYSFELFEAYTRGHDFIQEAYTTVRPEERDPNDDSETSRIMSYDDNYFIYKYSGRNIDIFAGEPKDDTYSLAHPEDNVYYALIHSCDLLQENDVTLGETYEQQDYFIEAASVPIRDSNNQDTGIQLYKDTFKIIDYLDPDTGIFDPTQYTEEDITVHTAHIDLTQCEFYRPLEGVYENGWCDCAAKTNGGKATVECAYQKMGYCPYRFQTEKHPRRIRTLQDSQSNRFNLIQELCETFEFYPYFYIEHESNGHCVLDENGEMKKHVFFATEKGSEKYAGFRYEKNLESMSREVDSS
ncbi:MAG: hypothetical protein LUC37_00350 [Prevotella sp.]|nr:hypothetical protein [Prevotella sp.]